MKSILPVLVAFLNCAGLFAADPVVIANANIHRTPVYLYTIEDNVNLVAQTAPQNNSSPLGASATIEVKGAYESSGQGNILGVRADYEKTVAPNEKRFRVYFIGIDTPQTPVTITGENSGFTKVRDFKSQLRVQIGDWTPGWNSVRYTIVIPVPVNGRTVEKQVQLEYTVGKGWELSQ